MYASVDMTIFLPGLFKSQWNMARSTINALWKLLIPVLIACSQQSNGEVFSASADLTTTFRLEEQVVNVLAELLARTEAKLGAIRR